MTNRRPCTKRCFTSVDKIKQHLKRIRDSGSAQGFRVRTYYCDECDAYHLTNHEKAGQTSSGRSTKRQKTRRLERKRQRSETSKIIDDWKDSA